MTANTLMQFALLCRIFVWNCAFIYADHPVLIDNSGKTSSRTSTHCGLFALKAAATVLDLKLPAEQLFGNRSYLSSPIGSTGADLQLACHDFGIGVSRVIGLTSADLVTLETPALINLGYGSSSNRVGHWVAILGSEGNSLRVYDNLSGMRLKCRTEVDLFWDGSGLLIAKNDVAAKDLYYQLQVRSIARKAIWLGSILGVFLTSLMVAKRNFFTTKRFGELSQFVFAMICTFAAVFFGSLYSWPTIALSSYLVTRGCFEMRSEGDTSSELEANGTYIRDLGALSEPVILDVRTAADFRRGAMPKAINVPIDGTVNQWIALSENLRSARSVVIYCQSANCPWAVACQSRLACMKIPSFVYAGGYERYAAENESSLESK